MRNCMDKIYFPLQGIYQKIRGEDKRKEQLLKDAQSLLTSEEDGGENAMKKKEAATAEDYKKAQAMNEVKLHKSAEGQAKTEAEEEKS